MNIAPFDVVVFFISLIIAILIIRQIFQGLVSIRAGIFWLLLWIVIAITALHPPWIDILLKIAGWEKRLNLVLVISIIGLFSLVFHLFSKVEILERMILRNIQELSLQKYTSEYKGDSESDKEQDVI